MKDNVSSHPRIQQVDHRRSSSVVLTEGSRRDQGSEPVHHLQHQVGRAEIESDAGVVLARVWDCCMGRTGSKMLELGTLAGKVRLGWKWVERGAVGLETGKCRLAA